MKIKCCKCNKKITSTINSTFSAYKISKVECPYCHAKQRRHISEADLSLYLSIICMMYSLMAFVLLRCMDSTNLSWKFMLMFFGLFIVMFLGQNEVSAFIYTKAPFKKETMNSQELYEQPDKIKRKLKLVFAICIGIIVIAYTSPLKTWQSMIITFVLPIVAFVRSMILIRKEKSASK